MPLINQTTNLKSLRFGKDRIGGGSSNQPYVKSSIPQGEGGLGRKGGPDFLLRGGTLAPERIVDDVSRLTQMFFDTKSPNGLLFTAKQNILSRTAVATNGDGKILNAGAYLPTSTLLQAAGNPLGVHLNKQGLDPFKGSGKDGGGLFGLLGISDPLGLPFYTDIVKRNGKSKLETYLDQKQNVKNPSTELYSYSGGPGSILGVGRTKIPISSDRTGINNSNLNYTSQDKTYILDSTQQTIPIMFVPGTLLPITVTVSKQDVRYIPSTYVRKTLEPNKNLSLQYKLGASTKYFSYLPSQKGITSTYNDSLNPTRKDFSQNVYLEGSLDNKLNLQSNLEARVHTLTQKQINDSPNSKFNPKIGDDFRIEAGSGIKTLSYLDKNIEQRVNLGDPGKKLKTNAPLDKVNSRILYKSSEVQNVDEVNDLVKFRIGVIDNKNPNNKTYIHFRAFLDSMDDNYNADWQSQKLMGRGENFYRYNGFDRKFSLSWTVAAQSKNELIPMYQKLNYLASVCAPDYSSSGYMRGNLITLTVGGYLYEQVGIMTGISYGVPTESPWEIGIPYKTSIDSTGVGGVSSDKSVQELPHMIKVTGFNFIPIHDFTPKVQSNDYDGVGGNISKFGKERYIALENGFKLNNYDSDNYI